MVDMHAVQHFQDFVVIHDLHDLLGDVLELLEVEDSVFVLAEEGEDRPKSWSLPPAKRCSPPTHRS